MIDLKFKINDFVLCTNESKISFQGREICIEPRLAKLLSFLASNPETVFSREELINTVWEGAIVTEQVVTQSIFELRKILTECDQASIITTIPKRGYKLSAQVELVSSAPQTLVNEPIAAPEPETIPTTHIPQEAPFPSAPLTRAVSSFNSDSQGDNLISLRPTLNKIALRMFDILILLTVGIIVGYQALYQTGHKHMPEYDNQLIAIEAQSNPNIPDDWGYLSYGISRQLQTALQQVTTYRTRYISDNTKTPGKHLTVSIERQDQGVYLRVKLYSQSTDQTIYSNSRLLTDDNLSQALNRETIDLLIALGITPEPARISLQRTGLPNQNEALKQTLLAQYYLSQQQPMVMSRGITLINNLLINHVDNGYLLAQRYLGYAEMQALSGQPAADPLQQQYGKALLDFQHSHPAPHSTLYWNALALNALYRHDDAQARQSLEQAKSLIGDYTSLGYIIFGKLQQQSHPRLASEAYSQAYYLNASQRTYLLCKSLLKNSHLNDNAPILANMH